MERAKVATDTVVAISPTTWTCILETWIPVTQDVVTRRAFSLGVKKINGFLTVQ